MQKMIFMLLIAAPFSLAAAGEQGALVDMERVLQSQDVAVAYREEVEALNAETAGEYAAYESALQAAADLQAAQEDDHTPDDGAGIEATGTGSSGETGESDDTVIDRRVRDFTAWELDILAGWRTRLDAINLDYDNRLIALDRRISRAMDAVMKARNLDFVVDAANGAERSADSSGQQGGAPLVDITADVIRQLEGK
jgi:Skp family chaperone for outer membrane proteins